MPTKNELPQVALDRAAAIAAADVTGPAESGIPPGADTDPAGYTTGLADEDGPHVWTGDA